MRDRDPSPTKKEGRFFGHGATCRSQHGAHFVRKHGQEGGTEVFLKLCTADPTRYRPTKAGGETGMSLKDCAPELADQGIAKAGAALVSLT